MQEKLEKDCVITQFSNFNAVIQDFEDTILKLS